MESDEGGDDVVDENDEESTSETIVRAFAQLKEKGVGFL